MNNLEIITLNKPKISDFAKERNFLLQKSKKRWVLFLDTDEKLTPELEKEIEDITKNNHGDGGYFIKRKIYFLGRCVGKDNVIRLATKNSGVWRRAVHEIWDVKKCFGTLNNYIIHNTGDNLHDYIGKMNFYSDIHAKENFKEEKRATIFKIIFYPKIKFIQNIFQGRGFIFSLMQSLHSFLGWTKLWELTHKQVDNKNAK